MKKAFSRALIRLSILQTVGSLFRQTRLTKRQGVEEEEKDFLNKYILVFRSIEFMVDFRFEKTEPNNGGLKLLRELRSCKCSNKFSFKLGVEIKFYKKNLYIFRVIM